MPDLIFLNGTSSSGKTSIAKILQELLLPEIYLNYSIDNILYALPPSQLNAMTSGGDLSGLNYDALVDAYYDAAHAILKSGSRLIMDDSVITTRVAQKISSSFGAFKVLKVGLQCKVDELRRREVLRGDRRVGSAEWEFPQVHLHLKYDLELDTTSTAPDLNAKRISDFIKNPAP